MKGKYVKLLWLLLIFIPFTATIKWFFFMIPADLLKPKMLYLMRFMIPIILFWVLPLVCSKKLKKYYSFSLIALLFSISLFLYVNPSPQVSISSIYGEHEEQLEKITIEITNNEETIVSDVYFYLETPLCGFKNITVEGLEISLMKNPAINREGFENWGVVYGMYKLRPLLPRDTTNITILVDTPSLCPCLGGLCVYNVYCYGIIKDDRIIDTDPWNMNCVRWKG